MLVLPGIASIIFILHKGENPKSSFVRRERVALYLSALVALVLTLGPSFTSLFYRIPLVLALQFSWRFVIGDALFFALLSTLFFSNLVPRLSISLNKHAKQTILVVCLLLILASSSLVLLWIANSHQPEFQAHQSPTDPYQARTYAYLSNQTGYYRIMVIDRYNEAFPQYVMKGSIDGWYDQATTQGYGNFRFNAYYCGPNNSTINALRLLGVRYILVDREYGGDAAKVNLTQYSAIYGAPVNISGRVYLFRVPNSKLIYVTSAFPNGGIRLNQGFGCGQVIPGAPLREVGYHITNLTWGETKISFNLATNASSHVLISNSYMPGWHATDKGTPTNITESAPGLPVIYLPVGNHQIVLYYSGVEYGRASAIISSVSVASIFVVCIVDLSKKKTVFLSRISHD